MVPETECENRDYIESPSIFLTIGRTLDPDGNTCHKEYLTGLQECSQFKSHAVPPSAFLMLLLFVLVTGVQKLPVGSITITLLFTMANRRFGSLQA